MSSKKKPAGCRLCKFRVSIPKKESSSERVPVCCFHEEIDDTKKKNCMFFTESDYYIKHPEEP